MTLILAVLMHVLHKKAGLSAASLVALESLRLMLCLAFHILSGVRQVLQHDQQQQEQQQ